MRLSTEAARDEARGVAVIHAALDEGVRIFDTARSYALDEADAGHNERLLTRALASHRAGGAAFIVTKSGIARPQGKWVVDGRAATIEAHAERSAEALGRPADLLLIHAPDQRVPWATTVRALARVHARGLAKAVGVSNVNLKQLDEALELAPISAVQVGWSAVDDRALRSGVVSRCLERGLGVMAHTPLGGPKRAAKVARQVGAPVLLRAMMELHPLVVVIPGPTRVETVRDCAKALSTTLSVDQRSALAKSWSGLSLPSAPPPAASLRTDAEVVLIMGMQGSGKSTRVHEWVGRGYHRLNRDELGGTLKKVAERVNVLLGEGVTRLVLDNTYTSRAARAEVLQVATQHSVPVRGVWLEVPLHEAQVNVVWRMLDAHNRLLEPEELKRSKDNTALGPMAQLRMLQELEAPNLDEGFTNLEVVPFERIARRGLTTPGRFVAAAALDQLEADQHAPTLVFDWCPDGVPPELEARAHSLGATLAVCRHPAGPPACWCRPPLPGLLLHFAHTHGVDPARSTLIGTSSAHEVMAGVVGANFVSVREKSQA